MKFLMLVACLALLSFATDAQAKKESDTLPCKPLAYDLSLSYSGMSADTPAAMAAIAARMERIKNTVKEAGVTTVPLFSYNLSTNNGVGEPESIMYSLNAEYELPGTELWPKLSTALLKDKDNYQLNYSYSEQKCDKK